jgi:Sulfotransferase family
VRHLLHIGYPKTGSNALRAWFAAHPQVAFEDGAIAGFPTVYDIATSGAAAGPEVRCRVTSGEGLATPHPDVGRPSVGYGRPAAAVAAAQARVCADLAALFPNASVLIVTRGFRSMILSAYSQYVRTGGTLGFAGFCATGLEAVWDYDRLIALYEAAFGAESVIVLPWEGLRDDPAAFARTLADHLGLDSPGPSLPAVNAAVSPAALAWFPRLARRLPPRLFARAAAGRRLEALARLLQRLSPLPLPSEAAIPASVLAGLDAAAARLRTRPAFAPYVRDYGFAGAAAGSGGAGAAGD